MTITVEHVTRENTSADGFEMEVSCNRWIRTIDEIKVNGGTYASIWQFI